jgi:very-short-patch-repair endonuclease
VQRDGWYRIPVSSVNRFLKDRWPPQWLAFYQTKVFGSEAYAITYYGRVKGMRVANRRQLFPNELPNKKRDRRYYQIHLESLEQLAQPIFSRRWRRIVFIPTTWAKLMNAIEINDLYDASPLEDRLWAIFKRHKIEAERQYDVKGANQWYLLDFAVLCEEGKLDVETDGDTWHANPERSVVDNQRDNELTGLGWSILRFTTAQVREQAEEYCVPRIMETINRLGGMTARGLVPRRFNPDDPNGPRQLILFDEKPDYG